MSEDQNWENGSFEEYIRRTVEDPQLEFDPGAWEAMEEKLDARSGETRSGETLTGGKGRAGNAGKIGAGVIALLLMSLLGWFLLSGTEENAGGAAERQEHIQLLELSDKNNGASAEQDKQEVPSVAEAGKKQEKDHGGGGREGNAATPSTSPGVTREPLSSRIKNEGVKENSLTSTAFKAERSHSSARKGNPDRTLADNRHRLGNTRVKNSSKVNNNDEHAGHMDALPEADATNEQGLQRISWLDIVFDNRKSIPVRPAEQGVMEDEEVPEGEIVPASGKNMPLSLSLSLAPDFSGMGKDVNARLGAGAGFHLEYRVLPRLGIVTGLVYSQKNYLANSSYSPYDFGYSRPKADYIDASCGVLDIPLNLRYYLFQGRRNSFFLSTGLSSYLMKREDYTLVYADYHYEDYTYKVRNENRHYFAVYNFSAGYEARMSPRWALQAEPFLKIPARGLGAGSIRLNSIGAFLHLKYSIGRLGK